MMIFSPTYRYMMIQLRKQANTNLIQAFCAKYVLFSFYSYVLYIRVQSGSLLTMITRACLFPCSEDLSAALDDVKQCGLVQPCNNSTTSEQSSNSSNQKDPTTNCDPKNQTNSALDEDLRAVAMEIDDGDDVGDVEDDPEISFKSQESLTEFDRTLETIERSIEEMRADSYSDNSIAQSSDSEDINKNINNSKAESGDTRLPEAGDNSNKFVEEVETRTCDPDNASSSSLLDRGVGSTQGESESETGEKLAIETTTDVPSSSLTTTTTMTSTMDCEETSQTSLNSNSNDSSNNESNSSIDPKQVDIKMDNSNSFNSFQFWRRPLPEVDVDLDLLQVASPAASSADAAVDEAAAEKTARDEVQEAARNLSLMVDTEEGTESAEEATMDVSEVADAMNAAHIATQTTSAANSLELQDSDIITELEGGVGGKAYPQYHTASVITVSDKPETVENIGTTHVIGQHLNQQTMTVVNGVVQG